MTTAVREGVAPLAVEDVTLRFGGITALDGVSFTVAPGTVHALIGPNGAGKSSCFNVISGLYRPTEGRVRLGDAVLTDMAPHKLAGLGIGRSFQNIALSPGSTVLDNVMLGRHALTRGGFLSGGLRLGLRTERRHVARAEEKAVAARETSRSTATGTVTSGRGRTRRGATNQAAHPATVAAVATSSLSNMNTSAANGANANGTTSTATTTGHHAQSAVSSTVRAGFDGVLGTGLLRARSEPYVDGTNRARMW